MSGGAVLGSELGNGGGPGRGGGLADGVSPGKGGGPGNGGGRWPSSESLVLKEGGMSLMDRLPMWGVRRFSAPVQSQANERHF
jgi:hypothetical protein